MSEPDGNVGLLYCVFMSDRKINFINKDVCKLDFKILQSNLETLF